MTYPRQYPAQWNEAVSLAFGSNAVTVGTSATKICSCGFAGALVQNLGTVAVTIGGTAVTTGNGPTLPASMTSPVFIPGRGVEAPAVVGGVVDTCDLYGITASSTATVVFATPS